jgi:hypothetical protein
MVLANNSIFLGVLDNLITNDRQSFKRKEF